jgi:hypothetical protein
MMTKQDLDKAKKAFDFAWSEATKYADEALEAMRMHDQVQARDTDDLFTRKAKRALVAHDNWCRAAQLASKTMEEYYGQFRPK